MGQVGVLEVSGNCHLGTIGTWKMEWLNIQVRSGGCQESFSNRMDP